MWTPAFSFLSKQGGQCGCSSEWGWGCRKAGLTGKGARPTMVSKVTLRMLAFTQSVVGSHAWRWAEESQHKTNFKRMLLTVMPRIDWRSQWWKQRDQLEAHAISRGKRWLPEQVVALEVMRTARSCWLSSERGPVEFPEGLDVECERRVEDDAKNS